MDTEVQPAELKRRFATMSPIKLDWRHTTPTVNGGLELFITQDLSVTFEKLFNAEGPFSMAEFMVQADELEMTAIEAKKKFKTEYFPARDFDRVLKSFKEDETTAFFTSKHIELLTKLFEEGNYMAREIKVYFNGQEVKDINTLPSKEFDDILDLFQELEVFANIDFLESEEELRREREETIAYRLEKDREHEKPKFEKTFFKENKKQVKKSAFLAIVASVVEVAATIASKKSDRHWGIAVAAVGLKVLSAGINILNALQTKNLLDKMNRYVKPTYKKPKGGAFAWE